MNLARTRPSVVPDAMLLLAACLLASGGLLIARALAMEEDRAISPEFIRQAIYIGLGLLAMGVASRTDYRLLRTLAPQLFIVGTLALVLVLAVGSDEYGSRRWISIGGGITVQPSEFAKVIVAIAGAAFAAERAPTGRGATLLLAIFAFMVGLIIIEPDLGTSIVFGLAWFAVAVAWGVAWRYLGGLVLLGVSMFPLALALAIPDYQRERLAVFLDPARDPLGSGFTLRQVEVAFSAGGVTGRGFNGASSTLAGVAPRSSDFAFAQLGEFGGVATTIAVIALFAVVAWRGYRAAAHAPDEFGRLLAVGLTTVIVLQAAIHIAVNMRLFPATGIPLPFVSTGGSALLAVFTAIGILQSIAAHRAPHRGGPARDWTG
ncbi:MAG: FtsW/RodA/SpoVE family cell cycle protein [Chloroflexi bacterium]|nr:FtsW/RodA/SpoVE family cell cycle protein [Chloroflexota bacterium]